MGEKVKDLSSFEIGNETFLIEYNRGWKKNTIDIHIQSPTFRYCIDAHSFMELFSLTVCAKRKFDSLKCKKEDNKDV